MTPLLTISQAAERLNMSVSGLRKWVDQRKIAAIKYPGRAGELRFKEEHLENWLNSRTIKAKPITP